MIKLIKEQEEVKDTSVVTNVKVAQNIWNYAEEIIQACKYIIHDAVNKRPSDNATEHLVEVCNERIDDIKQQLNKLD